MAKKNK